MVATALLTLMLSGVGLLAPESGPPEAAGTSSRSARLLPATTGPEGAPLEAHVARLALLDADIQRLEAGRPRNTLALVGLVLGSITAGGGFFTLFYGSMTYAFSGFGVFSLSGSGSHDTASPIALIVGGAALLVGLTFVITGAVVMKRMSRRNDEIDAEVEALEGQRQVLQHPPGATAPELPVIPLSFSVTVARF
jgi:hypothetical protein